VDRAVRCGPGVTLEVVAPLRGRVLVVDDDPATASAIGELFSEAGFEARPESDARRAPDLVRSFDPDLVTLDMIMPGIDGVCLWVELRRTTQIPILVISGRSAPMDRVIGLRVGADGYMSKPFDGEEVLARAEALLRRSQRAGLRPGQLRCADLTIDLARGTCVRGRVEIRRSAGELKLLALLGAAPGRTFGRGPLAEALSMRSWVADSRAVDVYIGRIRRKLDGAGVCGVRIETVHGAGYRLHLCEASPNEALGQHVSQATATLGRLS